MSERTKTINEFRESIDSELYDQSTKGLERFEQVDIAKLVRGHLEMAFLYALRLAPTDTFDDNELLFAIAALPHDTSLDALIKELAG